MYSFLPSGDPCSPPNRGSSFNSVLFSPDEDETIVIKSESLAEPADECKTLTWSEPEYQPSNGAFEQVNSSVLLSQEEIIKSEGDPNPPIQWVLGHTSHVPNSEVDDSLMKSFEKMPLCISKSGRGGDVLIYGGYEYVVKRKNVDGKVNWRCRMVNKSKCRSTMTTNGDCVVTHPTAHSHDGHPLGSELPSKKLAGARERPPLP